MRKAALKRANSVCQCTCQAGKKIPLSSALTKLIEVGLNFSEVLPIFLVKLSTLTNCVFEKFLLDKILPGEISQRSIGSIQQRQFLQVQMRLKKGLEGPTESHNFSHQNITKYG